MGLISGVSVVVYNQIITLGNSIIIWIWEGCTDCWIIGDRRWNTASPNREPRRWAPHLKVLHGHTYSHSKCDIRNDQRNNKNETALWCSQGFQRSVECRRCMNITWKSHFISYYLKLSNTKSLQGYVQHRHFPQRCRFNPEVVHLMLEVLVRDVGIASPNVRWTVNKSPD